MLGFELNNNGDIVGVSIASQKIITIFVTRNNNGVFLHFSGSNSDFSKSATWYSTELKSGGHISVVIKDIVMNSEPVSIETFAPLILMEKERNEQDDRELKRFYELRKLLAIKDL